MGTLGDQGPGPLGVQAAAWQLVWLSREAGDGGLALLAGELLALVGPSDPFAIALPHAAAPRGGGGLSTVVVPSEAGPGGNARKKSKKAAAAAPDPQQVVLIHFSIDRAHNRFWLLSAQYIDILAVTCVPLVLCNFMLPSITRIAVSWLA